MQDFQDARVTPRRVLYHCFERIVKLKGPTHAIDTETDDLAWCDVLFAKLCFDLC